MVLDLDESHIELVAVGRVLLQRVLAHNGTENLLVIDVDKDAGLWLRPVLYRRVHDWAPRESFDCAGMPACRSVVVAHVNGSGR